MFDTLCTSAAVSKPRRNRFQIKQRLTSGVFAYHMHALFLLFLHTVFRLVEKNIVLKLKTSGGPLFPPPIQKIEHQLRESIKNWPFSRMKPSLPCRVKILTWCWYSLLPHVSTPGIWLQKSWMKPSTWNTLILSSVLTFTRWAWCTGRSRVAAMQEVRTQPAADVTESV